MSAREGHTESGGSLGCAGQGQLGGQPESPPGPRVCAGPAGRAGNTACCVLAAEWDHTYPCTLQELYAEPVLKSLQAWRSELKHEAVKS